MQNFNNIAKSDNFCITENKKYTYNYIYRCFPQKLNKLINKTKSYSDVRSEYNKKERKLGKSFEVCNPSVRLIFLSYFWSYSATMVMFIYTYH
jgi:predicted patatin/cPLA2 family phospholipase